VPKRLLKAIGFTLRKRDLDWFDVAKNTVYRRAAVGCRSGAAGFCCVKDKELYVSNAADICIALLPAVAPAVTVCHRIGCNNNFKKEQTTICICPSSGTFTDV
jgi:hypothetical protein